MRKCNLGENCEIQNLPIPFTPANQQHLMHSRNPGKLRNWPCSFQGLLPAQGISQLPLELLKYLCSNAITFMGTFHCKLRHRKSQIGQAGAKVTPGPDPGTTEGSQWFPKALNSTHTEWLHQGIFREGEGKIHSSLLLNKVSTGRSNISRLLFLPWSRVKQMKKALIITPVFLILWSC